MTLQAKIKGTVRNVSPAMARRLRAKGIAIEDTGVEPESVIVAVPKPPALPVKKLEEVLPPAQTAAVQTPPEPAKATGVSAATANIAQNPPAGEAVAAPSPAVAVPTPTIASREAAPLPPPPVTKPVVADQVFELEFEKSSNVRGATLDTSTGIATVRFANNTAYRYANFTAALMAEWKAASSAGSWFHANVRSKPAVHPIVEAPKADPEKG